MATLRRLLTLGVVAYSATAICAQNMNPIEMGADVPVGGDPGVAGGADMATAAPADSSAPAAVPDTPPLSISPAEVVMLDNGEQAMKRKCAFDLRSPVANVLHCTLSCLL
jgi:hypothetical protein